MYCRIVDALVSMNEVVLSGFAQLGDGCQGEIAAHVMDKDNWAKQRKQYKVSLPMCTYHLYGSFRRRY